MKNGFWIGLVLVMVGGDTVMLTEACTPAQGVVLKSGIPDDVALAGCLVLAAVSSGATLASVVEYLEPYLTDPKKWTKEQITDFSNDGLYFLAYAGIGMKKPEYIALYRKLERPESAWLGLTDLIVGRYEAAGHQTRH